MFELYPKLKEDSILIGRFSLSLLLLSRDANYPWCILVPERDTVQEIHHLGLEDRQQLMVESCRLAEAMDDLFDPDKINIGVLGNIVPQLHMHHIARFNTDAAWPGPVWGAVEAKQYSEADLSTMIKRIQGALTGEGFEVVGA